MRADLGYSLVMLNCHQEKYKLVNLFGKGSQYFILIGLRQKKVFKIVFRDPRSLIDILILRCILKWGTELNMSIFKMGVICSIMSLWQKRKNLDKERNQQRVRVLHQRCFKNRGTYCHIYEIYILELFIHKLCIFGIQCHRRCQCLANKEFVRRRTEQMKIPESPFYIGVPRHHMWYVIQPMEKKNWQHPEGHVRGRWNSRKKSKLQSKTDGN